MKHGILNIIKKEQLQTFALPGYFENPYPSIRRCYDTRFIPFFFKHIESGINPSDAIGVKLYLCKMFISGKEIVEINQKEIAETYVFKERISDGWVISYDPKYALLGVPVSHGSYYYKIVADSQEYASEPFMCCFNNIKLLGDFNNDFNNDFF